MRRRCVPLFRRLQDLMRWRHCGLRGDGWAQPARPMHANWSGSKVCAAGVCQASLFFPVSHHPVRNTELRPQSTEPSTIFHDPGQVRFHHPLLRNQIVTESFPS